MRRRLLLVAMMAVLLIAGLVSSVACEMTCVPPGQMACCAQPSIYITGHCTDVHTASLRSAGQCGHSHESAIFPVVVAQHHAAQSVSSLDAVLSDFSSTTDSLGIPSVSFNRSSFITPLRI